MQIARYELENDYVGNRDKALQYFSISASEDFRPGAHETSGEAT